MLSPKHLIYSLCMSASLSPLAAQTAEEVAVMETVKKVFDGMRQSDTTLFKSAFHPQARFLSTMTQNGVTIHKYEDIRAFIHAISQPRTDTWDERISSYEIRIDDGIAAVWMHYAFFLGAKFSHCGVNAITVVRTDEGWRITDISDTRRIAPCGEQRDVEVTKKNIHTLLDSWHQAAAVADEKTFFELMTSDAVYLGTDASERWLRDQLRDWSKDFFAKDTAWAFTPKHREIYLHTTGDVAWFEESLATWMGECRGTGIVSRHTDGWRIRHYHLTLPIPNDKMKPVMELLKPKQ